MVAEVFLKRHFFFSALLPLGLLVVLCGCSAREEPVEVDPQQIDQLYRQALEYIENRQPQAANATYQQMLEIDPDHYEAWLGLAEVQMRQRRFAAALPYLERAKSLDPQRIEARLQLARTYLQLERIHEARTLLQNIVVDFPRKIYARLTLAQLLMTQAPPDPQGALEQYIAIIAFAPTHFRARSGAAACRLHLGFFFAGGKGR